jgi:hypothetical protein
MKTKTTLSLTLSFLLALVCGNLFSQSASETGTTTVIASKEPATASCAKGKDILVITGKILDASTKQPVKYAKLNFDKFGEEVLQASLDDKGNYVLTLNKEAIGEPLRMVFKIAGYKRYVIKCVDKKATQMTADIYLEPSSSDDKSNANVKYVLSDDPYNTTVIKMQ